MPGVAPTIEFTACGSDHCAACTEVRRLRAIVEEDFGRFVACDTDTCGHPDTLVDDERSHPCPWCVIDRVLALLAKWDEQKHIMRHALRAAVTGAEDR